MEQLDRNTFSSSSNCCGTHLATEMSRQLFIDALKSSTPTHFVDDYFYDRIPFVFQGDRTKFVDWKRRLGRLIGVDPACITLVGSGATGFSMNPNKSFRQFDEGSDIDVAIISTHYFTLGWHYLRMNGSRRLRLDSRTKNAWDEHVSKYIYFGTLATDKLLGVLPFGKEWLRAGTEMANLEPTFGRSVKFRIYMDYDALRSYQVSGVQTLRNNFSE